MPGTMENLGFIKDGKLTSGGKKAIITRIKNILANGGENSPFPCKSGKSIPPVPPDQTLPDDIEDETKYPEFHNITLKQYESVLLSLNQQGNFSLPPPFIDPVALAQFIKPPPETAREYTEAEPSDDEITLANTSNPLDDNELELTVKNLLGVDTAGNIPREDLIFDPSMIVQMIGPQAPLILADIMGINAAELGQKLVLPPTDPAAIIKPPELKFDLPVPPVLSDPYLVLNANISLPVPAPGFVIPYPDKIEFDSWQLKLPKLFAKILSDILSNPTLLFKLISPNPEPCFIIDAAEEAGLFGTPEPGANVRSAVQKDLMTMTGQATAVNVVAKTIGDGGKNGATGYVAEKCKFTPEIINNPDEFIKPTKDYKSIEPIGGSEDSIILITDERTGTDRPSGLAVKSDQAIAFRKKFIEICKKIKVNPDFLATVIFSESRVQYNVAFKGGRVTEAGPKPIAMGYIGFHTRDRGEFWKQLLAAGPVGQLDYVQNYYTSIMKKLNINAIDSVGRLYQMTAGISPGAVWQKGLPPGHPQYLFYEGNKSFDKNNDDKITGQEIANIAEDLLKRHQAKGKRVTISGEIIRA